MSKTAKIPETTETRISAAVLRAAESKVKMLRAYKAAHAAVWAHESALAHVGEVALGGDTSKIEEYRLARIGEAIVLGASPEAAYMAEFGHEPPFTAQRGEEVAP